ncbi:hypothetical protein HDV03_005481 [Kappamyces sp. JEL0829]|nr:hypothetical protein HDV03_005481 [Kappamyces sp. JEL0829]
MSAKTKASRPKSGALAKDKKSLSSGVLSGIPRTAVDLAAKPVLKVLDRNLEREYAFLSIQPLHSHYLIEDFKLGNRQKIVSNLAENLHPTNRYFGQAFGPQTLEDLAVHKEIYSAALEDAAHFGYKLGFRPFQLSVWLSITVKTMQECIDSIKREDDFSIHHWSEIAQKAVLDYSQKQEADFNGASLFTTSQYREIMEYMVQGFCQHCNLLKYVVRQSQDLEIHKVQKRLEVVVCEPESLQTAISEENWPEYCRAEQDKKDREAHAIRDQEAEKARLAKEEADRLSAEEYANLLKTRLAEAEKMMQLPLPPYPVPPPRLPDLQTLFRKQIVTTAVPSAEELAQLAKDKEERERKEKLRLSNADRLRTDLLPPPVLKALKPLEKSGFLSKNSAADNKMSAPQLKIEYEEIHIEKKLTREETVEIITANVAGAADEYKKWVFKMLEYEEQQWALRSAALQKARAEKEANRLKQLELQEAKKAVLKNTAAEAKKKGK